MPSEHQGLPAVAEGRKDLGATHAPQRMNGAQEMRRGWHPACPLVGEGPAWHQRVHVAMRVACLLPGVSEHEATALAPQVVRAALAPRLAGRPHQQGEPGAFVGEDERVERRRQGKDTVAIGHWQQCGWSRFEPCCRGESLARGTVAMATRVVRIALEATRPALFRMSPALRGPTGQEGLPHLLVGWRHGGCGAVCLARAAPDVGDFPRWSGVLCPAYGGVAAPGERGQGRSPRPWAEGIDPPKSQGALDVGEVGAGNAQIAGGGIAGTVPEQERDGTQVNSRCESMGGAGVAQRVEACAMLSVGGVLGAGRNPLCTAEGQGLGAVLAWKPPRLATLQRPISPQCGQQTSREPRVAVCAAFALSDAHQPTLPCNVRHLEMPHCTDPPTGGRGRHQQGAVRGIFGTGRGAGGPLRSGHAAAVSAWGEAAGEESGSPRRASWWRKTAGHRRPGDRHARPVVVRPAEEAGRDGSAPGAAGRGNTKRPWRVLPPRRQRPPGSWGPGAPVASGGSS